MPCPRAQFNLPNIPILLQNVLRRPRLGPTTAAKLLLLRVLRRVRRVRPRLRRRACLPPHIRVQEEVASQKKCTNRYSSPLPPFPQKERVSIEEEGTASPHLHRTNTLALIRYYVVSFIRWSEWLFIVRTHTKLLTYHRVKMAGLVPVTFDPEVKKVQAKGYVSSSIRQLQEQLQYQPGFAPDETGSNGSVSPPPSPGTTVAPTPPRPPQLDVRKKQLAIQLGTEFAKRQEASVKAHLSAWRARPLKDNAYDFATQVGERTHTSQHVNSASAWLRETNPAQVEKISTAPKSMLKILEKRGLKAVVHDKWNEVNETDVEKLLEYIRDTTPVDDWDRTRVLGLGQREVLENSFSKIVNEDCSTVTASPSTMCRCIMALCLAGFTDLAVVKSTIQKQSAVYKSIMRVSDALQSPPPPSPSCRTAPYPMKSMDPRAELLGLQRKPGKVSVVRQRQLEVLLEHAKRRQREELLFYKRKELTQPLQDYHKRNGIRLGMTPIQVPCVASPTCFVQSEQSVNCDQSVCSTVSMSVDDFELESLGGMDVDQGPAPSVCSSASVGSQVHCVRTTAELLGSLKLSQYTFDLKDSGYDLPTDLIGITKQELLSIGLLPGHAQRLLNAIEKLPRQLPPKPPSVSATSWTDSPVLRSLMES
eukprot:TRINITY_DN13956_c0_g1_i1.p1 TRINITY_DN13956_c0_g1~~TRINITY_DN13956_c0_g1_i1.p1  ORF type:complete len:647 (+),score=120.60 TRINITY_DN13956_c0_g1_i1:1169-3109(+)